MARVMGLDVGDVRIGVAFSDPSGTLAIPHSTLLRARGVAEKQILDLISQQEIGLVVVGVPLSADHGENDQSFKTKAFCRRLERRSPVQFCLWDEHLSSAEASERLQSAGRKSGAAGLDACAAAVILQDYLDQQGPLPSKD